MPTPSGSRRTYGCWHPSPAAWIGSRPPGLPLAGLTAYQALRRVNVAFEDTVLIHAAAGGVGSLATQLAVARGARVIGTASERNHDFLRSLGAEPVMYGPGLAERVRELAPKGVDAALDFVGGDAVQVSAQVLLEPGRVVSIADPNATARGAQYLWVRPSGDDLAAMAELTESGKLSVPIERAFPMGEAAEAWRVSQTERTRGKLVLTVD